mmetsp:Transcript_143632/g.400323  ORF Transcript_143632/g.400323 Transcript_143632/m.400323 type:complete len:160 (+) Transcript_143632:2-481(+)
MGGMGGMGNMGGMGSMGNIGGMGGMTNASGAMSGLMSGMVGMGGMAGMGGASMLEDGQAGKDNFTLGRELVTRVMDEMPSYVTQDPRGFVLRSAVPGRMVSGMQKRSAFVMESTGTKVTFHGDPSSSTRMMSVEGPLFNVCASYMLMMRRYLEVERELC